jgi:AcrR family transcriptional regulator
MAMTFRKVGRPPEDRPARQYEIYLAVVPLLRCSGVRGLSMGAAARAACMSVGGLYYYFPSKRALVLYGLQPEAITRHCMVWDFAHLAETDPAAFSRAVLDHLYDFAAGFLLPAYDAAVELGAETTLEHVRRTLEDGYEKAPDLLRPLVPQLDDAQVAALGASVVRNVISLLLDRTTPPERFRQDLDALIGGYNTQYAHPALV